MPAYRTTAVRKERMNFAASWSIAVHNVKLGETLWASARGMDVVTAEIGCELELIFGGDVGES